MPLHSGNGCIDIYGKYITDSEGIVNGKVLVTPAHFTFLPAHNDPVIMEYGVEKYAVNFPSSKISCVAMYNESEKMAHIRSQRIQMSSDSLHMAVSVDLVSLKTESDHVQESNSCLQLSHTNGYIVKGCIHRNSRSYSMDDIRNLPLNFYEIEKLKNVIFSDHRYLCLVADPIYRKIKTVYQRSGEYWFMVPTKSVQILIDYFKTQVLVKYDGRCDADTYPEFNKIPSSSIPCGDMDVTSKAEDVERDLMLKSVWIPEEFNSKILDSSKIYELMGHLPFEDIEMSLERLYTTNSDGWSLNTLYRNVYHSTRGRCLLIIEDSNAKIFGAMCSSNIRMSKSFYGNGTTFLFRWNPEFEKFTHSQRNDYFLFGQPDFFSVGCSNGNNAIRLEKDLFSGVTHPCDTFNSPILTTSNKFDVSCLEVWSFI